MFCDGLIPMKLTKAMDIMIEWEKYFEFVPRGTNVSVSLLTNH